jgi:PAS domain S-box-containing protein
MATILNTLVILKKTYRPKISQGILMASPHLQKLRDLTEELHAKDLELEQSRKTLASFFNMALDMLSVTDYDGQFLKLNDAWTKTLGWSLEELKASPFIEFVHPDDRRSTLSKFQKIVNTGDKAIYFRNRYRCKDGSYKMLCWTATTDPENSLVYAIARDYTAMMDKVTQ